jgi:hypothetical protein
VDAAENLLSLRDFISGLRAELQAAHQDALTSDAPDAPQFTVGPVNVEFSLTAKKDASAKGGVRFYVFELGASGSVSSESVQRVSLVLTPRTKDNQDYQAADAVPGEME